MTINLDNTVEELRKRLLDLKLWTAQSIEEDILPNLNEEEMHEYINIIEES
jgi:hypothetical protein